MLSNVGAVGKITLPEKHRGTSFELQAHPNTVLVRCYDAVGYPSAHHHPNASRRIVLCWVGSVFCARVPDPLVITDMGVSVRVGLCNPTDVYSQLFHLHLEYRCLVVEATGVPVRQHERGARPALLATPTLLLSLSSYLLLLSLSLIPLLSSAGLDPGEGKFFLPGRPAPLLAGACVVAFLALHEVGTDAAFVGDVGRDGFDCPLQLAQRGQPAQQVVGVISGGVQHEPITLTYDPACEVKCLLVQLLEFPPPAARM